MLPVIILMVIFGSTTAVILSLRYMHHRERLAEIEARKVEALAKVESQKALEPAREQLAEELLSAYDEVERSTHG